MANRGSGGAINFISTVRFHGLKRVGQAILGEDTLHGFLCPGGGRFGPGKHGRFPVLNGGSPVFCFFASRQRETQFRGILHGEVASIAAERRHQMSRIVKQSNARPMVRAAIRSSDR